MMMSISCALGQPTAEISVLGATDRQAITMGGIANPRMISFFDLAADTTGDEFLFTGSVAGQGATSELAWTIRPNFTQEVNAQPIGQLCNFVPGNPSIVRYGFFDGAIGFRNSFPVAANTLWTCGQGPLSNPSAVLGGRGLSVSIRQGAAVQIQGLPDAVLLGELGPFTLRFSNSIAFFSDYGTLGAGVLGRGLFFNLGSPTSAQKSAVLGESVVGAGTGVVIDGFEETDVISETDVFVRVRLRGGSTTPLSDMAVIRATTSAPSLLTREGQPVFGPGGGGLSLGNILSIQTFAQLNAPLILAEIRGNGVTSLNDTAFLLARPGSAELVIREGSPVLGLPQGTTYSELGTAAGAQDFVLVTVRLAGPGVTSDNDEAVFLLSPARATTTPLLIAREGDPASGTGANFGSLFTESGRSLAFPVSGFNTVPTFAFAAPLAGPNVTPSNNSAVFLGIASVSPPLVSLTKALRKGDFIAISPGINRIISAIDFSVRSGGGDGRQSRLTRAGTIAARVEFADGAEGVLAARLSNLCPVISRQPSPNMDARPGRLFFLSVGVVGSSPLTLQWSKDGTALTDGIDGVTGATSSFLTVDPARESAEGNYTVHISNACGSVTSSMAHINVLCVADVDDGSGLGIPDNGVTVDDLLYYLARFEGGMNDADVDDGSATNTIDGGVTIDDLLYYLFRFENGC